MPAIIRYLAISALIALALIAALPVSMAERIRPLTPTMADLSYVEGARKHGALNTLDIWAQPGGRRPCIIFIHGGGWHTGDKRNARILAPAITNAGYALASINYRLLPDATVNDAANDIASAIAFLQRNADAYGIDPTRMILMGHSAGAHLAALTLLNNRYLAGAKVDPSTIKGVILLDGIAYDMDMHIKLRPKEKRRFGQTPEEWQELSPADHVGDAVARPPFLIAYGDAFPSSRQQGEAFSSLLKTAGFPVEAKHYDLPHTGFIREWLKPGARIATDCLSFLKNALRG